MTKAKWVREVRAKIDEALFHIAVAVADTDDARDPFDAKDAEGLYDAADGACEVWRDMWRVAQTLQDLADDVCPIMARHMTEATDGMEFESADFVPPESERARDRRFELVREHYIERRVDLADEISEYRLQG